MGTRSEWVLNPIPSPTNTHCRCWLFRPGCPALRARHWINLLLLNTIYDSRKPKYFSATHRKQQNCASLGVQAAYGALYQPVKCWRTAKVSWTTSTTLNNHCRPSLRPAIRLTRAQPNKDFCMGCFLRALAECRRADASLGTTIRRCLPGLLAVSRCTTLRTWLVVPPNERAARVCGRQRRDGRRNSKQRGDDLGSRRRPWFAAFICLALAVMQTPRVSRQLPGKSAKWKSFLFHVTTAAKTSKMTVRNNHNQTRRRLVPRTSPQRRRHLISSNCSPAALWLQKNVPFFPITEVHKHYKGSGFRKLISDEARQPVAQCKIGCNWLFRTCWLIDFNGKR